MRQSVTRSFLSLPRASLGRRQNSSKNFAGSLRSHVRPLRHTNLWNSQRSFHRRQPRTFKNPVCKPRRALRGPALCGTPFCAGQAGLGGRHHRMVHRVLLKGASLATESGGGSAASHGSGVRLDRGPARDHSPCRQQTWRSSYGAVVQWVCGVTRQVVEGVQITNLSSFPSSSYTV